MSQIYHLISETILDYGNYFLRLCSKMPTRIYIHVCHVTGKFCSSMLTAFLNDCNSQYICSKYCLYILILKSYVSSTRVSRRVPLVEQEFQTLLDQSTFSLSNVHVAQSLVFYLMFCRLLFVFFFFCTFHCMSFFGFQFPL